MNVSFIQKGLNFGRPGWNVVWANQFCPIIHIVKTNMKCDGI